MGVEIARPARVAEAIAQFARARPGEVAVLAGGTDLLNDIERGRCAPTRLLSVARLPWRAHTWRSDRLIVGSVAPLRELELDRRLARRLPGLYTAVRAVGSVALRERATVGGNVARAAPASDLLPMLLAYDARVDLEGPRGRRSVLLDDLLDRPRAPALRAGELIASVTVPLAADSVYRWQRVRPANDVSQVGVAVVRSDTRPHWRVALGGVPDRAVRLRGVERLLGRAKLTPDAIRRAAARAGVDAPFVTDKRATASYRRRVVSVLLARALEELQTRSTRAEDGP